LLFQAVPLLCLVPPESKSLFFRPLINFARGTPSRSLLPFSLIQFVASKLTPPGFQLNRDKRNQSWEACAPCVAGRAQYFRLVSVSRPPERLLMILSDLGKCAPLRAVSRFSDFSSRNAQPFRDSVLG
jgi:hypothetical protein